MGKGDGTFQGFILFATGGRPMDVLLADLDGDDVLDVVTGNQGPRRPTRIGAGDVSVLRGNGDGTFQAAVSSAAGLSPGSVAVGDLDGDTILDLVAANAFSDGLLGDVSVLLGNGDGTFQDEVALLAGFGPSSVAVADLDGDNAADIVTANKRGDNVTVHINLPEPPEMLLAAAALATLVWLRGVERFRVRSDTLQRSGPRRALRSP